MSFQSQINPKRQLIYYIPTLFFYKLLYKLKFIILQNFQLKQLLRFNPAFLIVSILFMTSRIVLDSFRIYERSFRKSSFKTLETMTSVLLYPVSTCRRPFRYIPVFVSTMF